MSGKEGHISRRRMNRLSVIGYRLPYGNSFTGATAEGLDFYGGVELRAIIFGEWEKDEILFLLENKKNAISAINSEGDTTNVYCPKERRDELVEILKEKFGMLTFGEENSGKTYIAVDNMNHVLLIEDSGNAHLIMHRVK